MKYDEVVIQEFADSLYAKANSIVVMHAVLGVLIGLGGGYTIGEIIGAILGGVILGIFGYSMGTQKAFQLKLQAQTAICQVQIEKNTQKSSN